MALIFGFRAFRSRIKGVNFSILSQALTYAACLMFFRSDFTFGGNNGLTDFEFVLGQNLHSPGTKRVLFLCSGPLLLVEQYLDFCLDVGDRFYIMDCGSIVAAGPIQQLNDDIVKLHLTV